MYSKSFAHAKGLLVKEAGSWQSPTLFNMPTRKDLLCKRTQNNCLTLSISAARYVRKGYDAIALPPSFLFPVKQLLVRSWRSDLPIGTEIDNREMQLVYITEPIWRTMHYLCKGHLHKSCMDLVNIYSGFHSSAQFNRIKPYMRQLLKHPVDFLPRNCHQF